MSRQNRPRLYWKDALRQVQARLDDEAAAARQRKWSSAYQRAQADLESPEAIVWLPDEIAAVIRPARPAEAHPSPPQKQRRLTALLLTLFLLVPALISYLLAYRRIVARLR